MKKLVKIIITNLLTFVLLLANFNFGVINRVGKASANEKTEITNGSSIYNQASIQPDDFEKYPDKHPFTASKDENFMMVKENELLLYYSKKNNNSYGTRIYENFNQTTSFKDAANGSEENIELSFVTAVSVDITGSGRKDHVIYYGVNKDKKLTLVIYNAVDRKYYARLEIGDVSSWIDEMHLWSYKSFINITAGDYDGNGIDEIACTNANNGVEIIEVYGNKNKEYYMDRIKTLQLRDLLKENVFNGSVFEDSDYIYMRPVISLTSGNFDTDNNDELAVGISSNDTDPYDEIPIGAITMNIAMINAPFNASNIMKTSVYRVEEKTDEENLDAEYYRVLYSGQISSGDIDGDRIDEVVISGYTGVVTKEDNELSDIYDAESDKIGLCYAKLIDGNIAYSSISVVQMTTFIYEGFYYLTNDEWPPLTIATAKLNGAYGKASVFVGGSIYDFIADEAVLAYNFQYFSEESFEESDAYVEHVTVGTFTSKDPKTGEEIINEQFIFSISMKESLYFNYTYQIGYIGKNDDKFFDNTSVLKKEVENSNFIVFRGKHDVNETGCGTAVVPVCVDNDNDGIKVRYSDTEYFYADPNVVVVLQAAPYFSELGGYDDFDGSTSYSVTTSKTLTDISGKNLSLGVGLKFKWGADEVGEVEAKVGYAMDISWEYEDSYTTSYTTTFEAGAYDTVVVDRTPYIMYEYTILDDDGNDTEDVIYFMEPLQPVYYQLSVDEYNTFVKDYNKRVEDCNYENINSTKVLLKEIDDTILPSNTQGNPGNYHKLISDGQFISKGTYALSYNGGSISSEFSEEFEAASSVNYAHGLSLEVEGTYSFGGIFEMGGYLEFSMQRVFGSGEAVVEGSATGGTVVNIDIESYVENGISRSTVEMFGFNWRSALWKRELMTDDSGNSYSIPVVGYIVTNVTRPQPAPTNIDTTLSLNGQEVIIVWENLGSNNESLLGYEIFRSYDARTPEKIATRDMVGSGVTTYTDTSKLKYGKIYTYYVVAVYKYGSNREYLSLQSESSNIVWGIAAINSGAGNDSGSNGDVNFNNNSNLQTGTFISNGSLMTVIGMVVVFAIGAVVTIIIAKKRKVNE